MAQISCSELEDKDCVCLHNDSWTLRAENPSWHGYGEDSASAKSSAMESLRCMTYVILLLVSQGSKNPLLLLLFLQILLIKIFLTANDCSLLVSYMTKCLLKPNMIVHAKNENSAIIYPPSYFTKLYDFIFTVEHKRFSYILKNMIPVLIWTWFYHFKIIKNVWLEKQNVTARHCA